MASELPFDVGVIVEDFGYKWPLSAWRHYYHNNVTLTGAITHEQFARECPRALEALQTADAQYRRMQEVLGDPAVYPALVEVAQKIVREAFTTGGAPQAMQGQFTPQAVAQAQAEERAENEPPAANALQPHTHGYAAGQTATAEANGHVHNIVNGECEECEGHTHALKDLSMDSGDGSGAPAAKAVPPMAGPTPNPLMKQGG